MHLFYTDLKLNNSQTATFLIGMITDKKHIYMLTLLINIKLYILYLYDINYF